MKQFLKITLACTLGVFLASVILLWMGVVMIAGIVGLSQNGSYQHRENSVLYLNLKGELAERSKEELPDFLTGEVLSSPGLDDILKAIAVARKDDNIKGIYIEANGLRAGYASLGEIRQALLDFKECGKFVLAYGDHYLQKEYYMATAADSVFLNPVGALDFRGLCSTPLFYKNALEKAGVNMQIFRVGTFKSAVEPYMSTQMSAANREQTEVYLQSIWDCLLTEIGASRNLTAAALNAYADSLPMLKRDSFALQAGLIDGLVYRPEMGQKLARLCGVARYEDVHLVSPATLAAQPVPAQKSSDIIAVVYACGEIDLSPREGIHSRELVAELDKIGRNENIKGVVVRVNSPGGSAFGSEQLWEAISRLKAQKPVAVSMGDYAASGGYYLSCNADRIFADATTLSGSIGIFGMVPDVSGLLTDKIGITFDEVKTNRYGNVPTFTRPMTTGEKALMQGYIERGYDLFVKRCAEGRNLPVEEICKVAEGRVWSGSEAVKQGLVDELGTLDDAVNWVAGKAGTESYRREEFPAKKSFYEELLDELTEYGSMKLHFRTGQDLYRQLLKQIGHFDPIQAWCEIGVID
ncbi:MAG: signal peptide peptidase SppA [Coprobacter sp.]|nr:signal peptide peptidase SppA [Coprobacter sp.]